MKRVLLFAMLLLWALCNASHSAKAQGFKWGARDGVTISNLIGIDNTLPNAGFYVGVFAGYDFDSHWGLTLDVNHSEQGALCRPNDDGVTMDYVYDYLNIPLMLEYGVELRGGHWVSLQAGVQAGIFLIGSYEYSSPSILGDDYVSGSGYLDSADFHPVDFGLSLGAEWCFGGYALELRYTLGITQTHDGISNTLNGYYYISVPDNRNSVFQVGTKFYF